MLTLGAFALASRSQSCASSFAWHRRRGTRADLFGDRASPLGTRAGADTAHCLRLPVATSGSSTDHRRSSYRDRRWERPVLWELGNAGGQRRTRRLHKGSRGDPGESWTTRSRSNRGWFLITQRRAPLTMKSASPAGHGRRPPRERSRGQALT